MVASLLRVHILVVDSREKVVKANRRDSSGGATSSNVPGLVSPRYTYV